MLKRIKKKETKKQAKNQRELMNGYKKQNWNKNNEKKKPLFNSEDSDSYLSYLKAHQYTGETTSALLKRNGNLGLIVVGPKNNTNKEQRIKLPKKPKPLICGEILEEKSKLTDN